MTTPPDFRPGRRLLAVLLGSLLALPLGLGAAAAAVPSDPPIEPQTDAVTVVDDVAVPSDDEGTPEAPAEEVLADGAPAEDAPAEEAPAEEAPAEESPSEEEEPATDAAPHPVANAATDDAAADQAATDAAATADNATADNATADGATDDVTDGIAPGQIIQVPIDVVNASSIRAVVAAPIGVDARIATEFGHQATAWVGASSTSKTPSMGFLEPTSGRFVLEIRNNTTETVTAVHEVTFVQAGGVVLDPRVSLTLDRLQIRMMIDDRWGPVSGATVSARVTASNGIYQSIGIPETSTGIYEVETGVMRSGDFTLLFSATVNGVEYTAVAAGRVVGTDSTGPIVTLATDPVAPNASGWFTESVEVLMSATDPQGVYVVWYQVDDGPLQTTGATSRIPIPGDGESVVRAWAWDRLFNISEPVTTTISVDATPAAIELAGVLAGGTVTTGQPAIAEFSCVDPHSDVTDCVLELEDGTRLLPGDALPTATSGTVDYEIRAVNGAGLSSVHDGSLRVVSDGTPPVIAVTTMPAASNARGWFARDVTVTLAASDPGSGVAWVEYRRGDEPWTRVEGNTVDIPVVTDGRTTITFLAADGAGNVTGDRTRLISLDRVAPRVSITGVDGVEVERGETLLASYACSDDVSGVLDCTASIPTGEPLPTDEAGSFTLRVTATDNAGNYVTRTATYTVRGPELAATATPVAGANAHGWWNEDVVVDLRVVEGDRIHWELEGAQTGSGSAAGSARVTVSAEGDTRLVYWVSDESGSSEPVPFEVRIDRTAPSIEYQVGPHETFADTVAPTGLSFDLGEAVPFDFGCVDTLSLVEVCESDLVGAVLPTDAVGTFDWEFRASDHAGNEVVENLVYTVVDPSVEPGGQPGPAGRPGTPGGLATTGLDAAPLALGVLVLIGLGSLLVIAARRRPS